MGGNDALVPILTTFICFGLPVVAFAAYMMLKLRLQSRELSEADLDKLASKLADRLKAPDGDRQLLLELAHMSDDEFRMYKEHLRVEREKIAGETRDRSRDRLS